MLPRGSRVPVGRRFLRTRPHGRATRNPRRRRSLGRRWPITRWPASLGPHRRRCLACGVGTGVEPVTARFSVWCSTTELTWLTRPSVRTHVRNARRQLPHMRTGRRAPLARPYHCFKETPVGVEPTSTGLQPVAVPSGSSVTPLQCPRQESNQVLRPSHVSHADPAHSEDISHFSALPRNRTPSCRFVVCRAIRYTCRAKCLDQESNLDLDLRRVLCDPLHHRDLQCPDLESNQGQGLRRALCDPLHHRDELSEPTTGFAPA